MNRDKESFGISFCKPKRKRVAIPPGLAALVNGSTGKASIEAKRYDTLPEVDFFDIRCRVMQFKNKRIVLLEWNKDSPFTQASSLLQKLEMSGSVPKTISVDAMVIEGVKGTTADRLGCLKAAGKHEVVVYEDRGEDLSYLRSPKKSPKTPDSKSSSPETPSGSEQAQEKIATEREEAAQANRNSPEQQEQQKSRLARFKTYLNSTLKQRRMGVIHSGLFDAPIDQEAATAAFVREPPWVRPELPPQLSRAEMGQVSPPTFIPVSEPADHVYNAFLEFLAVVRATKQVNLTTCRKILQTFNLRNEGLLGVLLEEAGAAVYDNSTSQVIIGKMGESYMAAYCATCGFVALDEDETKRKGKPVFRTPPEDTIVVVAGCTEIMLDDKFLEMAQTIEGTSKTYVPALWEIENIRWVNGVPGCGKTTWLVKHFDEEDEVVVTTTTEAAKDLREKLSHRVGEKSKTKVRTMASVLANGFKEGEKCQRLTVDEALMNHFGAIVMAAKLSGASEVVLIGDVNQLPYLDRDNLFPLRYTRPGMVASVTQELLCTHRNPMDVAFALSEIYNGIYSSKTSASNIHSLTVFGYSGAIIEKETQNTLFLVHTQEEKSSLSAQGYGSGEGSRTLTIHESQGLTYERVVIINTRRRIQIHDSVPHAVVAVSRHTSSCVYYTDDASDAIGRFCRKAMDAPTAAVVDYNLKTAMQHQNMAIVEALTELRQNINTHSQSQSLSP